jgi:hypothetical protein
MVGIDGSSWNLHGWGQATAAHSKSDSAHRPQISRVVWHPNGGGSSPSDFNAVQKDFFELVSIRETTRLRLWE